MGSDNLLEPEDVARAAKFPPRPNHLPGPDTDDMYITTTAVAKTDDAQKWR